jgi:AAA ATPase domain
MKLKEFQVTMYQSVLDSGVVDVGDVVCLVGKNEAGKTALLKALYKLNPIRPEDAAFSATDDYPRMEVSNYEESVAEGGTPDDAVAATYELSDSETEELSLLFGPSFLKSCSLRISKSYDNKRDFKLICDEAEAIKFMSRNLPSDLQSKTASIKTAHQFAEALELHAAEPAAAAIMPIVRAAKDTSYASYAFNTVLSKHEPKFLYFDEYYQMLGCENIEALKARLAKNMLEPQDQPLLGLIELAKLNLDKLLNPQSTQDLKNKLEGAGNYLTREIMRYWSQNKHLQMRFDVRPARPGDPERMRTGTNIWGEVYDTRHFVSTGLGTRSRGFVWFFSFVAWYSQIKHKKENVILLLDEPGLTLHGRAQGDLLRYFETELKPVHQLIYTTHSPFMVDPTHFDRVRIVQDLSIDVERLDDLPPEKQGTKVTQDIFDASDDSLFPLQGALGYDIRAPRSISISSAAVSVGTARSAFFDGVDCSSAFASA